MRRLLPLVAAFALAAGLAGGLPGRCVACSCAMPMSLAEAVARSPGIAVFVGQVVAMAADPGTGGGVATVAVDGRFRGPLLPPTIQARYGGGGDCTIGMALHQRRLFTASLDAQGAWFPSLCDPQGLLGTPEGDALLAEATATFGQLQPPGRSPTAGTPAAPPTTSSPAVGTPVAPTASAPASSAPGTAPAAVSPTTSSPAGRPDVVVLGAAAAVATLITAGLAGGVVVLARRRRAGAP